MTLRMHSLPDSVTCPACQGQLRPCQRRPDDPQLYYPGHNPVPGNRNGHDANQSCPASGVAVGHYVPKRIAARM